MKTYKEFITEANKPTYWIYNTKTKAIGSGPYNTQEAAEIDSQKLKQFSESTHAIGFGFQDNNDNFKKK